MIDPAALTWTVASAIGAVIALAGAIEAHRDLQAIKGYGNGRLLSATRDLRNQTVRFVIQVAWVSIGAPSILDERVTPWSAGVIVLVGTNIALAVVAAFDLRDRRRLMSRADDSLEARFAAEMKRTDKHQAKQDKRMDAHDVRLDEAQ